MKKFYSFVIFAFIANVLLILSCASAPQGSMPFEQYCSNFSQKTEHLNFLCDNLNNNNILLSRFEKTVGTLSSQDYDNIETILENFSNNKREIEIEIKDFKDYSRSITSKGLYAGTKKKN